MPASRSPPARITARVTTRRRPAPWGLFFGGGRLDFYRARNTREETMQADNRPLDADGLAAMPAWLRRAMSPCRGSVVGAGGMAELIAGA